MTTNMKYEQHVGNLVSKYIWLKCISIHFKTKAIPMYAKDFANQLQLHEYIKKIDF